ncbi:endothelin-converting enzyme 1-like [Ornithodoros turicata]|uniref:endothelin-converting enzyme 1-like n=1 Tax=Ornithodoros turicata TaxID=34597 RepID=UPI00313995EB
MQKIPQPSPRSHKKQKGSPVAKRVAAPSVSSTPIRNHPFALAAARQVRSPELVSPANRQYTGGKYDTLSYHSTVSSRGMPSPKSMLGERPSQRSSPSSISTKQSPPTSSFERVSTSSQRAKHRTLSFVMVMAGVLAILVTFLLAFILKVVLTSHPVTADSCITSACRAYAAYLKDSMNDTISPCDNFYGYVCGKKSRMYSVRYDAFVTFRDRAIQRIKSRTIRMSNQSAVDKAAMFYQSCENVLKYEDDGELPQVKSILQDAGITWPTPARSPDVLLTMLRLSSYWLWDSFISVRRILRSGAVLALRVGPSPHFSTLLRQRNNIVRANKYFDYFVVIYEALKTTNKTANEAFEEVRAAERDAVPLFEARLQSGKVKAETTISGFNYTAPDIPSERWLQGFTTHFSDLVESNPTIVVDHVRFFQAMPVLIERMGEANLHLYLSWTVVQRLILLSNARLVVNYHGNVEAAKYNQRFFCFHLVQEKMGFAFLSPYVSTTYTPFVRNEVENIVENVRQTFDHLYSTSFHPSDGFRAAQHTDSVLQYLDMFLERNVENYYGNYSSMTDKVVGNYKITCDGARNSKHNEYAILRHFRTEDDSEVAVLDDIKDEVVLAPNVLELPFYDEMVPSSVKYAALGSLLAESLMSLLLRTYPMWRANSRSMMLQTVKCLTGEERQLKAGLPSNPRTLHNIVSIATIDILLSTNKTKTDRAKGIGTISPDKTFFVIWCYVLCAAGGDNVNDLCNGPLRHVAEFALVFECAKNTSMRAEPTCKVFPV